jgi:D-aminopeptidase
MAIEGFGQLGCRDIVVTENHKTMLRRALKNLDEEMKNVILLAKVYESD